MNHPPANHVYYVGTFTHENPMTQDERNMLTDLATKFAQTPAPPKDPDAEELIRTRIGSRPDALYLMTQTVLIQNLALQHAQQQIQELQQRAGQPASFGSGASFLGQSQPGQAPPRNPGYAGAGQQYAAPPPPQYAAPSPASASPSGAPSFLAGAARTAAGVAAGALAFEGIQSLFSHPGYGGGGFGGFGGGGFGGGGFGGGAPEETVVNNYYDNAGGNEASGGNYDASNVDDGQQVDDSVQDASYDTGTDDGGGFDGGGGDNFV